MKLSRIMIAAVGVPLLAIGAYAAERMSLHLEDRVALQGTELQPGKYKVEWDGDGPNVKVTITNGKATVTVPATIVESKVTNTADAYSEHTEANGTRILSAIYPGGKKFELELHPAPSGD